MLFNSFVFALFLPLTFILYWSVFNQKSVRSRNAFLLVISYIFYGWWDWRFLLLIALTSLSSWVSGILIEKYSEPKTEDSNTETRTGKNYAKTVLMGNLILNIGILAVFKYFNFFVDTFISLFESGGMHLNPSTLSIVLPVGISFYTFQSLSYSIDVYRKDVAATKDWVQFLAFVSFFPQLVAGPIERAKNFLSQFEILKKPDYNVFRSALLLIAWGFFKKLMIADRVAVFVNNTFGDITSASGLAMLLGVFFFAFQLYLDFSAYSDIAIGCGRLFGFNLMTNFRRPYLSTSFANFWKRWHISLSSWFMDYVYIPLGGNRKGFKRTMINILIVFALSGLWHGASWNFVIWGVLNGLFMIAIDPLLNFTLDKDTKKDNLIFRILKSLFIFVCWTFSLIFFRARDFKTALECFNNIGFSNSANVANFGLNTSELYLVLFLLLLLFVKELIWERSENALPTFFYNKIPLVFRWAYYILFILSVVYFGQYGGENENAFIYFQF